MEACVSAGPSRPAVAGDVGRLGAALPDHYVAHGSMTKESAHDVPPPAAFLASTQTE
jgi:hypothetical protein